MIISPFGFLVTMHLLVMLFHFFFADGTILVGVCCGHSLPDELRSFILRDFAIVVAIQPTKNRFDRRWS